MRAFFSSNLLADNGTQSHQQLMCCGGSMLDCHACNGNWKATRRLYAMSSHQIYQMNQSGPIQQVSIFQQCPNISVWKQSCSQNNTFVIAKQRQSQLPISEQCRPTFWKDRTASMHVACILAHLVMQTKGSITTDSHGHWPCTTTFLPATMPA